jgi:hypothetical protein
MASEEDAQNAYATLLAELPRIAKIVNAFSGSAAQEKALEHLLAALLGTGPPRKAAPRAKAPAPTPRVPARRRKRSAGESAQTGEPTVAAKRKAGTASLKGRVDWLVAEGYFAEPRTAGQATAALQQRGYHYPSRRIAMVLLTLTRSNVLRRLGKVRSYEYVNA